MVDWISLILAETRRLGDLNLWTGAKAGSPSYLRLQIILGISKVLYDLTYPKASLS